MPIVQIDMKEGRTVEQKRQLVKKLTDVIVETAECPPEAVTIILREMSTTNFGNAGVLNADK